MRRVEAAAAESRDGRLQARVQPVGAVDILPPDLAECLTAVAEETQGNEGIHINVAVGYGGRREIADAVRALLADHATKGTSLEELADINTIEILRGLVDVYEEHHDVHYTDESLVAAADRGSARMTTSHSRGSVSTMLRCTTV